MFEGTGAESSRPRCACRGRASHLIVAEQGVSWGSWSERFASRRSTLVVQHDREHARAFAERVVERLKGNLPRCALIVLGENPDDKPTLAARARIGRALALALSRHGGSLYVAATPSARAVASALADTLATSTPANVRVIDLASWQGVLRLDAA